MQFKDKINQSVAEAVTKIMTNEGWDDMLKDVKKRNEPKPNGGSGVKQGTRYGGGKQKDEPEKKEVKEETEVVEEELTGGQKKLDKNKNNKLDAQDFKILRKEEVEQIDEKLSASADAGDYIKDFQKSDAPQFQGKSKEKRRIMGIAAYLSAKRGK